MKFLKCIAIVLALIPFIDSAPSAERETSGPSTPASSATESSHFPDSAIKEIKIQTAVHNGVDVVKLDSLNRKLKFMEGLGEMKKRSDSGDHAASVPIASQTLPNSLGHDSSTVRTWESNDNLSPFARMAGQGVTTVSTVVSSLTVSTIVSSPTVSTTISSPTVSTSISSPTVSSSTSASHTVSISAVSSPTVASSTVAASVSFPEIATTKPDVNRECVHPKDLSCTNKAKDYSHSASDINPMEDLFRNKPCQGDNCYNKNKGDEKPIGFFRKIKRWFSWGLDD